MMSKIIEVVCDPCDDKGVRSTATTHRVQLDGTGTALLDLCEEHAASLLQPLLELVVAHGVTESGRPVTQSPQSDGDFKCAYCGKALKNQSSISKHVEMIHPGKYEAYMTGRGLAPQKCPECSKTFYGHQALSMHVTRIHGKK